MTRRDSNFINDCRHSYISSELSHITLLPRLEGDVMDVILSVLLLLLVLLLLPLGKLTTPSTPPLNLHYMGYGIKEGRM